MEHMRRVASLQTDQSCRIQAAVRLVLVTCGARSTSIRHRKFFASQAEANSQRFFFLESAVAVPALAN